MYDFCHYLPDPIIFNTLCTTYISIGFLTNCFLVLTCTRNICHLTFSKCSLFFLYMCKMEAEREEGGWKTQFAVSQSVLLNILGRKLVSKQNIKIFMSQFGSTVPCNIIWLNLSFLKFNRCHHDYDDEY